MHDLHMTIGEHLEELRNCILSSLMALFGVVAVCLTDQQFYMRLVLKPHSEAMQVLGLPDTIQVLNYQESFFAHLKVSIIAALILTTPYIFYQIWLFVEAGLYSSEKQYLKLFFPFMILLFIIGIMFGYFILIPLALQFLGGYGIENIHVGFTLSSYITLFFILTFVCGVMFELPIVMLFLVKLNLVNTQMFLEQWRYFVLAAFVLAALLTPPDAVTQMLMAGPMICLYILGILVARISERLEMIRNFLAYHEDTWQRPAK